MFFHPHINERTRKGATWPRVPRGRQGGGRRGRQGFQAPGALKPNQGSPGEGCKGQHREWAKPKTRCSVRSRSHTGDSETELAECSFPDSVQSQNEAEVKGQHQQPHHLGTNSAFAICKLCDLRKFT